MRMMASVSASMAGSVSAFDGPVGQEAFSASKGGIVAMTPTLALHSVNNGHLNGEVIRLDGALRIAPR